MVVIRLVKQMKKNNYWKICSGYKLGIMLRIMNIDNCIYNFVERLMVDRNGQRCRRSTQRDDGTNGAHTMQESTDG